VKKSDAIDFLNKEGWTKADAQRVLKSLDFRRNNSITEIMILRAASKFAGAELFERQKLQAAQKTLATKRKNQILDYIQQIKDLKDSKSSPSGTLTEHFESFQPEFKQQIKKLLAQNKELLKANLALKKDNKDLKNITDAIKLKLTQETKHLLRLENNEIKKGLMRLLNRTLG